MSYATDIIEALYDLGFKKVTFEQAGNPDNHYGDYPTKVTVYSENRTVSAIGKYTLQALENVWTAASVEESND